MLQNNRNAENEKYNHLEEVNVRELHNPHRSNEERRTNFYRKYTEKKVLKQSV